MASVLQIVDPSDTSQIWFDLYDEDGSNNAAYGSVQTYLLHDPNWGAARLDAQRFESDADGGQTPFSRYGLVDCSLNVRFRATSYDNLAAGVNRLSFLLSQGCTLKWVPNGSSVTKYVDIEPSQTPALVDGRELSLYQLTSLFDLPEGVTLSLTRQPFFYQAELDPTVNVLENPTLLVDQDGDGFPDSWTQFIDVPSSLNPAAWYAADRIEGLSDGDSVSTWEDLSGHNYDATNTGSARPTYETNERNSLPVLRFNGTAQFLAADALAAEFTGTDMPMTVFTVAKLTSDAATATLFGFGRSSTATPFKILQALVTTENQRMNQTDDAASAKSPELSAGSPHTLNTWLYHSWRSSGTDAAIWRNGTALTLTSTDWNLGATTLNQAAIGCLRRTTNTQFWPGDIGEVIVFDRALSTAERQLIETYLDNKWGF